MTASQTDNGRSHPSWSQLLPFLPAAIVVSLWIALMPGAGGFFERDWLPAGLALAGLAFAAVAGGQRMVNATSVRVAAAALGTLIAWSFLSVAWAGSPDTAWLQSDLLLTSVLAAGVVALAPWRAGFVELMLGAFSLGVAAVFAVELLSTAAATDLTGRIIEDRWAGPLGYPNGSAALAVMAALPALVLSARPGRGAAVKGVALAIAMLLLGFAFLSQSRGSVLGAAAGLAVALAFASHRWRLLARVAVVGGLMILVAPSLGDVYDAAAGERAIGQELDEAIRALALSSLLAGIVGVVLALVDARVRIGPRGVRAARAGGIAALAAGLLALGGLAVAERGAIGEFVEDQWDAMADPGAEFAGRTEASGGSRLLQADPVKRYDYWRVALNAFEEAPVGGAGAGGFRTRYVTERRYDKNSDLPHNIALRALAELGVVGALLALTFAGAILIGLMKGIRRASVAERGAVAGATAAATAFVVHAQFDWLEAFPVLLGPALAFPLAALVACRRVGAPVAPEPAGRRLLAGGAAALLIAAVVTLGAPWLALRYQERAAATWWADPEAAYRDLDRAARVNPVSPAPLLLEGTIALQRREFDRAEAALRAAARRERSWLAHFELGLIAAAGGNRREATLQMRRASTINPMEPAVGAALEAIREGERIDPAEFTRSLFESPIFAPEPTS